MGNSNICVFATKYEILGHEVCKLRRSAVSGGARVQRLAGSTQFGQLLIGGIALNRPPLLSPPGLLERLATYLTTNVAATRVDHTFPELHPLFVPSDTSDAGQIRASVSTAMHALGWEEIRESNTEIRAVIATPLFWFRDDVTVWLEETRNGILAQAHSVSRVGIGGLAANARHIQELFAELDIESTVAGH